VGGTRVSLVNEAEKSRIMDKVKVFAGKHKEVV
jgi:hypothetical protein